MVLTVEFIVKTLLLDCHVNKYRLNIEMSEKNNSKIHERLTYKCRSINDSGTGVIQSVIITFESPKKFVIGIEL